MRLDAFAESQRRYVVRAEGGYRAFVPPALPPDLRLDAGVIRRLSDADRAAFR
jgi:hypothetical protein